jgi:hypothetical protein
MGSGHAFRESNGECADKESSNEISKVSFFDGFDYFGCGVWRFESAQ